LVLNHLQQNEKKLYFFLVLFDYLWHNVIMIKTIKLTNGKKVPLRKHQTEAISNIQSYFAKGYDRATIVHCCRSGKSLTSVALHKQLKSKASVVFLPSINLIQQTLEDWTINLPRAKTLVVSSDKSVYSGEVTTNPKKIKDFINRSIGSEFVIFSTYQSSEKLCKALSKVNNFCFDLLIADEAHRSAGVNLKQSRYIHFNSCISAKKRLYMTATPKFVSIALKKFLHKDAKVACMNDKDIFGKQVHLFSFKQGIESDILSDYEIVALGCKDQSKTSAINDQENFNHLHIKETAKLHALHKALESRDVSHCVSFHSTKSKAKFFEKNFNLKGWKVFHINGDHAASERKATLDAFRKADKALLTNCKCLNEGINLVECDSVFFSDVKSGAVDVVQSASRPLTKDDKKPQSFKNAIFIPTFHFETDSIERICETTSYKILIQLIRHMRGQDERIECYLRMLARGGASSHNEVEDIIKIEGFGDLTKDIFNSIIPHDIKAYSDEEIFKAFKASFDSGVACKGGMKTASENLGMHSTYIKQRALKSSWLRKKINQFRKDMQVSSDKIFNAVVEARGSFAEASRILGKSTNFAADRCKKDKKLFNKIEKWKSKNPNLLVNTRFQKSYDSLEEIGEAFRQAGYHKNRAGVILGKSPDYISAIESRNPELRDFLFQIALEIKPNDMTEEQFKYKMKFGGISNLIQKKKWKKEIINILEKDPNQSCLKIAKLLGAPSGFVYKTKREISKAN
jgi:predicted helicase